MSDAAWSGEVGPILEENKRLRVELAKAQGWTGCGSIVLVLVAMALVLALYRFSVLEEVNRVLHRDKELVYFTQCPHGQSVEVVIPVGAPRVKLRGRTPE